MSCQRCNSGRVLHASGKSSDLNSFSLGQIDIDEAYVLSDCNIGGGDYYILDLCLDCGQLQGKWPVPARDFEECDECGRDLVNPTMANRPTFPCKCDPDPTGLGNNMKDRCLDCGEIGKLTGHMDCEYPQDREEH